MDIIIASNNNAKIREFKKILEPIGYNVISQSEAGVNIEVEEIGTTFKENAELKARAIYNIKHTAVLADDSGLEVDFLNGEPGIYSARYMGLDTDEKRRECILQKLEGVEDNKRTARFVCCICYIDVDGNEKFAEGYWKGKIINEAKGNNGFGYDPIFQADGELQTASEMSPEEKNTKSHRALAIENLIKLIK